MRPGEYRFNGVKYADINKYFMGNLYASAIYRLDGKFILEVFAPKSLIMRYESEPEEIEMKIGEQWARNIMNLEKSKWLLERINYYIEVNGHKVGDTSGKSTMYRYEPDQGIVEKEAIQNNSTFKNANEEFHMDGKLRVDKQDMRFAKSPLDEMTEILNNSDFMDKLIDAIESLPDNDPNNPNSKEDIQKFEKEQEEKERSFFNKFRESVKIPEFLEKEPMAIADLIFREKNFTLPDEPIDSLKFIVKSITKRYLPWMKFSVRFGESIHNFGDGTEEWREYLNKVVIEGVYESKRKDGLITNIPEGKKAVLVKYKVLDNLSIIPIFYTTEVLEAYETSAGFLNVPKLLDEKDGDNFNKYMVLAGFVDEGAAKVDFELFQLVVDLLCDKEYVLI